MGVTDSNRESKLVLFSLGIVTEDKARNSAIISVYPVEELPMVNGPINTHNPKYKANVPDAKGVKRSSNVDSSAVLQAVWIPDGHTNRISAPDVVKNETVKIYRYADTDTYYWTTLFNEPGIRRLETVTYAFGNLKVPLKTWDKTSSYWMEVSTHDKYIQIHTTTSDGEPYEYDFLLNTRLGQFSIKDSAGNSVVLDSKAGSLTAKLNKTINLEAPTINLKCQLLNIAASVKVAIATPLMALVGRFTGSSTMAAAGAISSQGGMSAAGAITTGSSMSASGSISSGGNISAAGTVSGTNI